MRSSHQQPHQSFGVYGFILLLFIFCIMMIIHQDANASHMLGADLTYKHVTGKQYQVSYTLYRDCNGISAPANVNLKVQSENCSSTSFYSLELETNSGKELSHICSSALTTCQGGSYMGIQAWNYSGLIEIPSNCTDWKFIVTDCCRNSSISTIAEPASSNIYMEAFLNNMNGQNSSPEFIAAPESQLLVNQAQKIEAGAIDSDGDSLVYLLSAPKTGSDLEVNFLQPYLQNSPFGVEMEMNKQTGEMHFTPTQVLTGVYSVLVYEYRNGIHIGTTSRDFQVSIQASSNFIPVLSGINGSPKFSVTACPSSTLSFDIYSDDRNSGQQLNVSWNTNIPDAQITSGSGLHPVIHFSWIPATTTALQEPYFLSIQVKDDACPYNAVQNYTYTILVSDMNLQIQSTSISCPGENNGSVSAVVSGGSEPYSFSWSDSNTDSFMRENLSEGTYSVSVTDANGCALHRDIELEASFSNPHVALSGTIAGCVGNALVLEPGNGQASYLWSDFSTQETLEVNESGTYGVEVTNAQGCKSTGSIQVVFEICSGIEREEISSMSFSLFPNPAKDKLSIRMENAGNGRIVFSIMDIQGKLMETQQVNGEFQTEHILDLNQVSSGVYILQVETDTELSSVKFCKL